MLPGVQRFVFFGDSHLFLRSACAAYVIIQGNRNGGAVAAVTASDDARRFISIADRYSAVLATVAAVCAGHVPKLLSVSRPIRDVISLL